MSSASGTRTSLRTPVASRKRRDNEEIWEAESEIRCAKRAKRLEGFAYFARAEEDLEPICRQFSRLAEHRWTAAHCMNWSEVDSARSVEKALEDQIKAHFLSSPVVNGRSYRHSSSLNPLNITTSVARHAILMGHPDTDFDVSLEQISLRRGEHVVASPSKVVGAAYLDLLSDLLQIWTEDGTDSDVDVGSPGIVFYPPDEAEENAWRTIDMQELTYLDDEVLESGSDSGRWKVGMEQQQRDEGIRDPALNQERSQAEGVNGSVWGEPMAEMKQWEDEDGMDLVDLEGVEEDGMASEDWGGMASRDWDFGWDAIHKHCY